MSVVIGPPPGRAASAEARSRRSGAAHPFLRSTVSAVQPGSAVALAAVRVLLVDDHTLVRQALRSLLEASSWVEVVGEAEDGRQAVDLAARLQPDVVLMDLDLPGMSGLEATREIRRCAPPRTRVLLVGSRVYEEHLVDLLRAGAAGLVLKEATAAELLQALREVGRCEFYVSSAMSQQVLSRWQDGGSLRRAADARTITLPAPERANHANDGRPASAFLHLRVVDDPLTERERELLQLVAAGYTNQQIARALCISVKTVEAHKAHMVGKLALRGSADLARYAVQRRWLQAQA